MKSHWLAALVLLAWGALSPERASAEIFKCRDASGAVTFSDLPCPDGTQDEGPPPINSTPKSLGVDCLYKKEQAACAKLKIVTDGKPDVLAQAHEDAKYAVDRDHCLAGDYQACKRSICRKAYSEKKTAEDILACSRELRLPNGSNWAMVVPWKDGTNGMRKGQGYCLTPFVVNSNGRETMSFPAIEFRDNPNAAAVSRYQKRYSVSNVAASTLEEAASRACRR